MNIDDLAMTAKQLAAPTKGILAADESTGTITKRFQAIGIESNEENRRAYRELLVTTPGCQKYLAGVILFEETLNQKTSKDVPFPEVLKQIGILPGIKVDKGLVHLANSRDEMVTQGLDGLAERLGEYKAKGACFAKWRAVYTIGQTTPSPLAIDTNAEVLARYAASCQEHGIVPIVEPEVLIDGSHTLERCEEVSVPVFHAVFEALYRHQVRLEYIVLKPSMVISGKSCLQKASVENVAKATVRVLRETVPAAVPTINFLSGGQSPEEATAHLNAINRLGQPRAWNISFSYARALQDSCMKIWQGQSKNVAAAQAEFYKRVKLNSLASVGKYTAEMEKEEAGSAVINM